MRLVEVLGVRCRVLQDRVSPETAHPGEGMTSPCKSCKVVAHPNTGAPILVWGFRTGDFTVSRHQPDYERIRSTWPE